MACIRGGCVVAVAGAIAASAACSAHTQSGSRDSVEVPTPSPATSSTGRPACTLIGAVDGLTLDTAAFGRAHPSLAQLAVVIDGREHHEPTTSTAPFVLVEDDHVRPHQRIDVAVTAYDASGRRLSSAHIGETALLNQPNGPSCPPQAGSLRLVLDARGGLRRR